ncbi:hypothetical protein C8J55DRAFT_503067 [Lentinula edodes]|uniref:Uncharacterized protein n=1 Tax=Lentinula lateritia TaxID=40482 RepID=A0A9W9DZQ0_9AGAR|nr:hypothetical protein C8J55DRAFT_503067 [Lentinula edodes]
MLLLPPSLLRSLSVSVLIFPIIFGVLAMPLASHDDGLSTIPQLKLRGNPIRKRALSLKRYNMTDSLLRNVPCRDYEGLLLLDFEEKWVLVWGTKHYLHPQAEGNAWNIQRRPSVNPIQPSNVLGTVKIQDVDEQKVFDAIANIPLQATQFLALQKIVEYLLGEIQIPHHPLPDNLLYTPEEDWRQIFLAMSNPTLLNQYPCSPYLRLARDVSRQTWFSRNRKRESTIRRFLPYLGTVVENEAKLKYDKDFNSTLWDACQTETASYH